MKKNTRIKLAGFDLKKYIDTCMSSKGFIKPITKLCDDLIRKLDEASEEMQWHEKWEDEENLEKAMGGAFTEVGEVSQEIYDGAIVMIGYLQDDLADLSDQLEDNINEAENALDNRR